MDREALSAFLDRYRVPAFHAEQVFRWLYFRRRFDPGEWTDLARDLRERVAADAVVDPGRIAERVVAGDGTVKYRVELAAGDAVEAVYMEQEERVTLCVSSQIGCALGCDFCLTGRMGLVRHLAPGEIAGQVALLVDDKGLNKTAFNIVFMGMGEPLHNYDGVMRAFRLLVDPTGFGMSRRRITVSTSGMVPQIERLAAEDPRPLLAVSLNATTDEVRDRIMPVNRKYPIDRLITSCRQYARNSGDALTLEYVLLSGINDTEDDVRRLAAIVRSLPAKLNLIPFNPVPEWLDYRPPSRRRVVAIRDRLLEAGARVSIRWSRGAEARAACGQLALL
jgi:23S rRNA (adenine2503-C2)-methyltransferase